MSSILQRAGTGTVPVPRRGVGSLGDLVNRATNPRFALLALLLFTYVWRFQDLSVSLMPFRLAAIATLGVMAFLFLQPRIGNLRLAMKMPGLPLMVVFIAWMALVLPFGLDPARSWTDWTGTHIKTVGLMLFVAAFVTSIDNVKRIMALHIAGASVLAAFYVKGGFPLWGTPVSMYDVNDLALHLNMCIPMILYFSVSSRRKWTRLGLWALLGVFAVCVLMTQSRGGFLTLGMLGIVTMVRMRGASIWMRAFPFVFLLAAYPLLPEATQARLKTLFSPKDDYNFESEEGRVEIWKRGMGYVAAYPLSGVGNSNFLIAERTISVRAREDNFAGKVSHNSFVEVAAETGVPGFLLYVSALVISVVVAFRRASELAERKEEYYQDASAVASTLGISMFCFFIGGFFLSMAHMQFLMSLLGAVAGLNAVVLRQRDRDLKAARALA